MSLSNAEPDSDALEQFIIRFRDLDSLKSSFRPRDMLLPRFERDRFSVIGRPGEGTSADRKTAENSAFSVVYLRCKPGKGVAAHAHDSAEAFIVLSGTWEVTCGAASTRLEPFDVISVPPGIMHGLTNVGTAEGFVMAINEGKTGVPIQLAPEIVSELRAAGHTVEGLEYPPGAPGATGPGDAPG